MCCKSSGAADDGREELTRYFDAAVVCDRRRHRSRLNLVFWARLQENSVQVLKETAKPRYQTIWVVQLNVGTELSGAAENRSVE